MSSCAINMFSNSDQVSSTTELSCFFNTWRVCPLREFGDGDPFLPLDVMDLAKMSGLNAC